MRKYIYLMMGLFSVVEANEYFTELSLFKDLSHIEYDNKKASNMYYFDVSIGKEIIVSEGYIIEPSIGLRGGKSQNDGADYFGYHAILPVRYQKKSFFSSLFIKHTYVSTFKNFDFNLNNKNMTSIGAKFGIKSSIKYFLIYEHILNIEHTDLNQKNLNFSQDQIGIGIRFKFN